MRKFIPSSLKRRIRIIQRYLTDLKSGDRKLFAARSSNQESISEPIVTLTQPIFYNPLSSNKVENIQIAMDAIHPIVIQPGQIFSFWHILGNPTVDKGFKTGRNIIGDELQEDIGGGLCQVSGMIYHLALLGGLEIKERFPHTLDLYEEDKRYTPLGADATVVFGYKDIRFRNNKKTPIRFLFQVSQDEFKGSLLSEQRLPVCPVEFRREDKQHKRIVETWRSQENKDEFINRSVYKLPNR